MTKEPPAAIAATRSAARRLVSFFMDISFLLLIVSSLYTLSFRFWVHEGGLHLKGKLRNVRLYEQVVERTVASITLLPVR